MGRFLFTFGLILFGLSLGYLLQRMIARKILRLPVSLEQLRKLLLKLALLILNPITVVGAIWAIELNDPRLITLPFIGMGAIFLGGLLAYLVAQSLHLDKKQTGSLLVCGAFTNLGTMGGWVSYIFLGELGFGLVCIYKLFEEFIYYAVGFPIAKWYGSGSEGPENWLIRIRKLVSDPFILVSTGALLLGGLFHLSGLKRPEPYQGVNAILIPLGALLLITSIGLAMRLSKVKDYWKECLLVSAIKFLLIPLAIILSAIALGYHERVDGTLLKVVILLSAMPVAFNALIPPSLYHLDVDLANSCWLFSTAVFIVLILPILYIVINLF